MQVPRNFQLPAIHLRRKGRCEKRIAPFIVAMLALQENMSALAYNSSAHCTDRNNNNELEILNKKINFLQIASKCNYLSFSFFFSFSFLLLLRYLRRAHLFLSLMYNRSTN